MITIEYANLYPSLFYKEERATTFFEQIFRLHDHKSKGVLSIAFLNERDHSNLHGQFLQDYRPTDVITFPADPENGLVGEICVSVDRAVEQGYKHGMSLNRELSLYLIHGWLHLVGFDDQTETDRAIMRREEESALNIIEKDRLWPDFLLAQNSFEG